MWQTRTGFAPGRSLLHTPRKALRTLNQKSFLKDFVNFWRHMPTKWLQERHNGSKNDTGMPPRRASRGASQNTLPEVNWLILGITLPGRVHPFSLPRRQKSKVERLKAKENRRYSYRSNGGKHIKQSRPDYGAQIKS